MSRRLDPVYANPSQLESLASSKAQEKPAVPFQNFFQEALSGVESKDVDGIEYNFNYKKEKVTPIQDYDELLAQGVEPDQVDNVFRQRREQRQAQEALQEPDESVFLSTSRVSSTPFQLFIDKAVEVLESISTLDFRVNDLTEQYIQGKVSLDEVSIETMKLNLAVSFVTTILSSSTQAFKEITQLAI